MTTWILATGIATGERADAWLERPELRRATRNMALALAAVEDLLAGLPEGWLEATRPRLAVMLGTSHGELDTTVRFLKGIGSGGMARPFLFQNSLHNATLGFVSQWLGLVGPALTVSDGAFSGEAAVELAMDLGRTGERACSLALVIGVDALVAGARLEVAYPPGARLGEGAAAVLLCTAELPELLPLARLSGIERGYDGPPDAYVSYDAGAVEALARAARGKLPVAVAVEKPDGSVSRLCLEEG